MALTGLVDNTKYLRSDKSQVIRGANYGNGKLVFNGRYEYQPNAVIDRFDKTTQLATTNFVSMIETPHVEVSGSVYLKTNTSYSLTVNTNATISLPNPDSGINNEILVFLDYNGGTLNFGTDLFVDAEIPTLIEGKYLVIYDYNPNLNKWLCYPIRYGYVTSYNSGTVLFSSDVPNTYSLNIPQSAIYYLDIVGGGGGASGGTYGRFHHKSAGGGGAGGAAFSGYIFLHSGVYTIQVGAGGAGGKNGNASWTGGDDGTNSFLKLVDNYIAIAAGGQCGYSIPKHQGTRTGGVLTINTTVFGYTVKSNGINVQSSSGGAQSLYGGYGKGGDGVYKGWGNPGTNGFVRIRIY